jgi:hypothetical protein
VNAIEHLCSRLDQRAQAESGQSKVELLAPPDEFRLTKAPSASVNDSAHRERHRHFRLQKRRIVDRAPLLKRLLRGRVEYWGPSTLPDLDVLDATIVAEVEDENT